MFHADFIFSSFHYCSTWEHYLQVQLELQHEKLVNNRPKMNLAVLEFSDQLPILNYV